MNERPKWNVPGLSETVARWLLSVTIVKITHHWQFTGEDTSEHWIVLHADGKTTNPVKQRRFPVKFLNHESPDAFFVFAPDHAGLVRPNWRGDRLRELIGKIDAWEKQHEKDRAEFERLKGMFDE